MEPLAAKIIGGGGFAPTRGRREGVGGSFDKQNSRKICREFSTRDGGETFAEFLGVRFPRWWGQHVARGSALPNQQVPTGVLSLWAAVHG